MSGLEINDPIYVNRDSGEKLEGIVAFLGTVDFAEGDDWAGVRLTGSSAGQGKNDGSVKGENYFKCPPNCGLFVRTSALETRKLTKLEALRLRRELASTGISATASTTTTAAGKSPSDVESSTPGRSSRLEELRAKRAAITPGKPSEEDQQAVKDLTEKLKAKEGELETLKQRLATQEEEAKKAFDKVLELEQDKEELEGKLKSQPATAARAPAETMESEDVDGSQMSPTEQNLLREKEALEEKLKEFQDKTLGLTKQMEKMEKEHGTLITQLRSEASAYKNELQAMADQTKERGVSDASHYKEKAQLQAQIAAVRREVEDLKNEKIELESTVEDLTLDKEQLQEEKDSVEERYEEIKLDAETAQMEVEELKTELEGAKVAAERAGSTAEMKAAAAASGGSSESAKSDDMAQALSIQNSRLREALIRLREQSSLEKMEMTRQLKALEKEIETAKTQHNQNEELAKAKAKLEEEVNELKDMVEQGSAFEGMVEDLSDKVMELEEQNVSFSTTIRELEEAAELTAEMEEVQAEELRALTRDLEDRDTVIRNLEEAIKMQRKREEDFSRAVGNYRSTVETLKKEKEALLELQQGGEGEKSDLLASSQKALARAAQLVSDAAEMRKKEAQAVLNQIEGQTQKSLAERLEKLVPRSVGGMEISAIRGELLVAQVAGLASGSLDGIALSFQNNLKDASLKDEAAEPAEAGQEDYPVLMSDENKQDVSNMLHQSECAHVLIETGIEVLRLLAAGQWPDLLSEKASCELGSYLGHSVANVEPVLRQMLKSLKEEGVIDTHQSSIDLLRQSIKSAKHDIDREFNEKSDEKVKLRNWKPPGLDLFDNVTRVKFTCLGAAAGVAASRRTESVSGAVAYGLTSLLKKLTSLGTEAVQCPIRLANLDVQSSEVVTTLTEAAAQLHSASDELLAEVKKALLDSGGITSERIEACATVTEDVTKLMSQFSSALRSAKLNYDTNGFYHPLSPEAMDSWQGISRLARHIRSMDGDEDDINYLLRAGEIEQRLSDAIGNGPKLSMANAKVASLEKSLTTRSKEIAMQNARLSELEKLLAKTSAKPSPSKISASVIFSEDYNSLKEENRILTEAMDVLQEQVANYENEIRMLNSMKSPNPKRTVKGAEKGLGSASKRPQSQRNLMDDLQGVTSSGAVGALEATLFRPALHGARCDAAKWKNCAMSAALLGLPPLAVPGLSKTDQLNTEESNESDLNLDADRNLSRLSNALSKYRMEQASIAVVDLEKCHGRARALFRANRGKKIAVAEELDSAAASVKRCLSRYGDSPTVNASSKHLLGRVKLLGKEPYHAVSTNVSKDDLFRLNLQITA